MKRLLVVIDNNFKLLYNKFVDSGQNQIYLRLRVVRFVKIIAGKSVMPIPCVQIAAVQ